MLRARWLGASLPPAWNATDMGGPLIRVDLHVHTCYSPDSLTPLQSIIEWATRRGIGAVAITDHNGIEGALALQARSPIQVIVGEEIHTTRGEITGLFLRDRVPPGLSPEETVQCIRAQGGVVAIPHPLDRMRRSALDRAALLSIIDDADALEGINARVTFPADNRLAARLAAAYGLLQCAGSDAHQGYEIGRAYVEMPRFTDRNSFLASLARGTVHGHLSSPLVHVGSTYAKFTKSMRMERVYPE